MKKLLQISLILFPLWGLGGVAFSQNKYLVLFKDKANSNFSVSRPKEFLSDRSIKRREKQSIKITERDLPPNQNYINEVAKLSKIWYKSRWFNGALVETSEEKLTQILKLSFVKGIEGKGDLTKARLSTENKDFFTKDKFETFSPTDNGLSAGQLAMMGVDKMQAKGFQGEGIWIGVLDSGFQNSDKLPFFKHLFDEKRILGTYDFVFNEKSVYEDHNHGTNVLSCMAAFTDGQIVGTAPKASYLLLKTEDVGSETKIEEAFWLFGAEYADSVGVDVINTSLGYTEFDNAVQNYTIKNLNGNTAIITRAADFAANVGILVVCSAGNEGSSAWQKIGTPADADSVISVGAVNSAQTKASFSSFGGKVFNRVKPELSAQGQNTVVGNPSGTVGTSNGTSFSSPLLAGMAASFWQAYPQFTSLQIRDILIKSGSIYEKPDSLLGYGIPNFERAVKIADLYFVTALEKENDNDVLVFPNPTNENNQLKIEILKEGILEKIKVNLFDLNGKEVFNFQTEERKFTLPIDKTGISTGNYMLKIKANNLDFTKRIFIQK